MCVKPKYQSFLAVLVFFIVFAFLPSYFTAAAQTDSPALALNEPIEREIAAGGSHFFKLMLGAGQYARIVVKQGDINVFVKIFGPDGQEAGRFMSIVEQGKDERALFVSNLAGDHKVEINAPESQPNSGKYVLKVEEIRAASEQDQFLMEAQKTLSDAEQLHTQGTAAARQQAIEKYKVALQLWQKSGDIRGQADTLQYLALVLFSLGNSPEALEHLGQARLFYQKNKNYLEEAQTLRGLGLIYHTSGELAKALEYYEQGLKINRDLKNQDGEASDLGNIGGIYQYQGEYQKAVEYYRSALTLARQFQNKSNEARLLNNIGEVYRLLSEYQNALDYFDEALTLRRAIKNRAGEGNTLNNSALVYTALGDYSKALQFFNLSLLIRREIGDRRGESTSLNNIGFVKYKLGDYQNALRLLQEALELKRKSGSRRSEASTLLLLGVVYAELDEAEKALEFCRAALSLSKEVRDPQTEAASLKEISDIELRRGNVDEARTLIENAVTIIESMRTKVAIQSLRTSFFASKQDYYDSYIDLLMYMSKQQPSKGFDAEALQVSEKARARSLIETLSESRSQIRKGVEAGLIEREQNLQKAINGKEDLRARLADRKGAEEQLKAVEKELNSLLEQYNEVETQIRINSPRYANLTAPPTLKLKEIQNLLDSETMLLEYSLGEKHSFAWAVTSDSITTFELPKEQDVNIAARRVYELMTERNRTVPDESPDQTKARADKADEEFPNALQNLSQMILKPVAAPHGKKRLLIVADGALQYIPFAALPVPASNAIGDKKPSGEYFQPLILSYEIVNLPSASMLAVLRKKSNRQNRTMDSVAVIADPVFSKSDSRVVQSIARLKNKLRPQPEKLIEQPPDFMVAGLKRSAEDAGVVEFNRLRFSREEANQIAGLIQKKNGLKAVDFAAEKDFLLTEDLRPYRVLHFATHGLLNNTSPELSGLVLSLVDEEGTPQDGFLRLHEIYNLELEADLVVLSACQTALGKDIKGEGLIGLTRGFMYAGADGVVASLWKVEDRATAELMKRFYRAMLKDKQSPAASLRTAQIEMWRERQWQNPYYWAAFTLQGDWK